MPSTSTDVIASSDSTAQSNDNAKHVVYVRNLNERTNLNIMKKSLHVLFHEFGKVLDVRLSSNLRMRGQAFVTMASLESARQAVHDLPKFPLYGKPMDVAFARTESEAFIRRKQPQNYENFKLQQISQRRKSRSHNPIRALQLQKRRANADPSIESNTKSTAQKSRPTQDTLPDEYQPPNKTLFITQISSSLPISEIENIFSKYQGFVEFRSIPGRTDIAFVEFVDDSASAAVRTALHNTVVGDQQIKVNFAKQ